MFIVCPNCTTKYLVDPAAIGVAGREVRCAKCAHSWFQAPPEEMPDFSAFEQPNQKARPIPEGSSLPVKVPEKYRVPVMLKVASVLFLLLAGAASFVQFSDQIQSAVPALKGVYQSLGVTSTEGLVIADLKMESKPVNKKKSDLNISFNLLNQSREDRFIPTIRITVSKDGEAISVLDVTPEKPIVIKAGATYAIHKTRKSVPVGATHAKVELGNSFDLLKR